MKKLMVLSLVALVAASTPSFAKGPLFGLGGAALGQPAPTPAGPTLAAPEPIPADPLVAQDPGTLAPVPVTPSVALFPNVKYRDLKRVDPCYVPMIVEVQDPCYRPCAGDCGPKCVAVQICVPACCQPKVSASRNGHRVRYDYGKFEVQITSRNGQIVVDYDG